MIRPYILAETNWKHLKDATVDLAILPWGATEAHNYHMPYGTDNIEADSLAAEAARLAWERGAKVMVLPTVPYGINTGQTDIFLDMNLKATYHLEAVEDFHLEFSGGVKNVFNSFQQEFDSGPERDSDFIFGPAAPRSFFLSVKIGNLH